MLEEEGKPGPYFVEVGSLYQDDEGYFVWKAEELTFQQLRADFDAVIRIRKVRVRPGLRRVPLLNVYTFRELVDAGDLNPVTDLLASKLPNGLKDGDMVFFSASGGYSGPVTWSKFLSTIGAFLGLYITGNPMGFVANLGILSLFGIVLNAAIVYIEFAEILIKQKLESGEGLAHNGEKFCSGLLRETFRQCPAHAGKMRIMPISLTTLMTAGGLISLTLNIHLACDLLPKRPPAEPAKDWRVARAGAREIFIIQC